MPRLLPLRLLAAALSVALAGPCLAADAADVGSLGWLAGHWRSADGRRSSEELWLPPEGGLMLGVARHVAEGDGSSFEFLRIGAHAGSLAYFASPGGTKTTVFPLEWSREQSVSFHNPEHDFPQRIVYRREGDRLEACIEAGEGEQLRRRCWQWQRQPGAAPR